MRCLSPHREEYGKLFDFVNAKKLNIKNRGLKEVPVRVERTALFCRGWAGMDSPGFFFTLSFLLTLIEKRGACDPPPSWCRFPQHDLRAASAAPQEPPAGPGAGGAGTNPVGRRSSGIGPACWLCVDSPAPGSSGSWSYSQAWGCAFECAGLLAPGRAGPHAPLPLARV